MSSSGNVDLLLALECARRALSPDTPGSPDTSPTSTSARRAAALMTHRLSRLVVNSSQENSFDSEDWERITNDALAHTHAAFQLVGHTAKVVRILEAAGVEFLVIKGVALGALSQTPAGRGAGDVDILVDPKDVPRVHQIFLENEFQPALALPDMSKPATWRVWSFLDREATYVGLSTHIDLHWRISSQRHLFPSFAELYARRIQVTVAGRDIPTLSVPDSLAAACYHAYFDQFQPLRSLIDVVSVVKTAGNISLPAYSPKLQRLIAGVLHLTRELFPGVVDEEIGRLLTALPAPALIVKKRFDAALTFTKVAWEKNQDTGALWAKMRSEAPFDSAVDIVPRFVGKRLFSFAPWNEKNPTTPLPRAFINRLRVESGRRRTH